MFTGIIEEIGHLAERRPRGDAMELIIRASCVTEAAKIGDSIAVDGCCLTIEALASDGFTAFASIETLERTTLTERRSGDPLNLEAALTLAKPLGGHIVQGHVDGLGTISALENQGEAWILRVDLPENLALQCIEKGSIAIDGISLTIACLEGTTIQVAVIPATYAETTLKARRAGDNVNIETDVIGKYVRRFLTAGKADGTGQRAGDEAVSLDLLRRSGFLA